MARLTLPPLLSLCLLAIFTASPSRADFVNFETPQVHPIDLSPDGSLLAVCNTADNRVELFVLMSNVPEPIGSVVVGMDPVSARFRSDTELWVVNQLSDSVSIIDVPSRVVTHTLSTADEPADVIFSSEPLRPALVSGSSTDVVQVFFPADLTRAPETIAIEGEDPRAMAIDLAGRLHVAIFESGNGTTILAGGGDGDIIDFPPNAVSDPLGPYGGTNPPPNSGDTFSPHLNPGNPAAPPVGLIVRQDTSGAWLDDNGGDWSALVDGEHSERSGRIENWGLIDNDVAAVALSSGEVTGYAERLMNLCMAIAVNPVSGHVTVVGTEADNELRFEPVVNGIFSRVVFASFDPDAPGEAPTITDLNPHLDYSTPTVDQATRDLSIGDPRGIAWNADGTRAYITGMGSNNLVVVDQSGTRSGIAPTIEVGEGPTGIVADHARGQLYVLNRFEATLSIIDMASETEVAKAAFFDPTPAEIRIGRPHLYDTHRTSGLGQVSCASCHVDSRTDRLAWDLGDPEGAMVAVMAPRHNLGANFPTLGDEEDFTDFHPMKGPMTTQTLQDIIGKEPHHWRGDRDGIEAFNGAFISLLGDDEDLTGTEMQEFEDYLATITIPPNPFRELDNTLPTDLPLPGQVTGDRFGDQGEPMPNGNALRAFTDLYRPLDRGIDRGALACITCHTVPLGMGTDTAFSLSGFLQLPAGPKGERHHALVSVDGSSQRAIKVPQLRTLYDKLGFDMTSTRSRSGFGILHDGSVDGLSRFLSEGAFEPENIQEVADLVALMMAFSGSDFPGTAELLEPPGTPSLDAHAAVGRQVTLSVAESTPTIDALIALAAAGEIDLVAHSTIDGIPRSWRYLDTGDFAADEARNTASKAELLNQASASSPLTFTAVPTGTSGRLGGDRDRDGLPDYDEQRDFAPSITGHQNPFQANSIDSTGDDGSTEPDGVPDGENDFDGDGSSNAAELAAGTNPADNLSVEVPLVPVLETSPGLDMVTLSWDAAPLGEYQVQYCDQLDQWIDSPTGYMIGGIPGGRLSWIDDGPPATESVPGMQTRRFYRILWIR